MDVEEEDHVLSEGASGTLRSGNGCEEDVDIVGSQMSNNGRCDDETVARGSESKNESVRKIETAIANVNSECAGEWRAITLKMCSECEHTLCTREEVGGNIVSTVIAEGGKGSRKSDENNLCRNEAYKEYIWDCYGYLGKENRVNILSCVVRACKKSGLMKTICT